jgi:uncharacterized repeat protein (TIGR01451 family)
MIARQRRAGLGLLVLCGGLTAALAGNPSLRGAPPVPAHTAQQPAPPLPLEAPVPPAPPPGVRPAFGPPVDPPVPAVSLRVRVPATAAAGQELEYHITVENRSRAAAHHVLVRDPLPADTRFVRATPEPFAREPELLWQFGTLEPCATREIVLVLAATGPGEVRNCARVQFEHGECVATRVGSAAPPAPAPASAPPPAAPAPAPLPPLTPPPSAAAPVPSPPATASLALTKRGPKRAALFDPLSYQLTVTNRGPATATGVTVTDTLPEGLEAAGKRPLRWDLGTLAAGQQRTVEYEAIARKAGRWTNKAVVTAAGGLRQEASAEVVVREARPAGAAGLTVDIQDKDDPVEVGAATKYFLSVRNQGAASATHVVVTATAPAQMEVIGARGLVPHHQSGQRVTFDPITLQPGKEVVYEVSVKALRAGDARFRVELTADQLPAGPVLGEESTTIYDPNLAPVTPSGP